MGKEKKHTGRGHTPGTSAKERHKKKNVLRIWNAPTPSTLNARPAKANISSKHKSYYELVENKDKKKKLEFSITNDLEPPPGFEFVPIGNPELTQACKELSRQQDAMIFIVSTVKGLSTDTLAHQVNRIGHHVRHTIAEQARTSIGDSDGYSPEPNPPSGFPAPEPIPKSQREINEQADNAIKDLFPRIPNTDRRSIIERAFKKGATMKGEPLVGLAEHLTLSRRVQLAVLAHIRHTHTRYDQLLRETTYANARKAVEALCLDILVKWRGDEETGRDQLDEILREVIVISDSEDDGDDSDDAVSAAAESDDSVQEIPPPVPPAPTSLPVAFAPNVMGPLVTEAPVAAGITTFDGAQDGMDETVETYISAPPRTPATFSGKRGRRGFRRYQAALLTRWDEARARVRLQEESPGEPQASAAIHPVVSHHPNPSYPAGTPLYQDPPERMERMEMVRESNAPHNYGAEVPFYPAYAPTPGSSGYAVSGYEQRPVQMSGLQPVAGMAASSLAHRMGPHPPPSNNGPRLAMDPQPVQRTVVRSEEAQDYLVPSVEPVSPPVQPPDPVVPILIRTLPPPPRPGPSESYHGEPLARYVRHHSPSRGEDDYEYGPGMHPRPMGDNSFIQLASREDGVPAVRGDYRPAPPAETLPPALAAHAPPYASAPPERLVYHPHEAGPANPPPAYTYVSPTEPRAADGAWPLDRRRVPEEPWEQQPNYVPGQHPPLPPDVRVIRTNAELPEQQPYPPSYALPLHPPQPPPQGWPPHTGYR